MSFKSAESFLKRHMKRAFVLIADQGETAEVHLLRNEQMNEVKEAYGKQAFFEGPEAEKISKETQVSVLALPNPEDFLEPGANGRYLGEVYLNWEFAKGDLETLVRLMVHGLLHLAGYTHETEDKAKKMENKEVEILTNILAP